jgi:hypothetical protein
MQRFRPVCGSAADESNAADALIIMGWPNTVGWALGLIVGVNLITSGWAAIMMAIAGRGAVKTLASATR